MSDYFCRVTSTFDLAKEAIDQIADKCKKVVLYEHNERSDNIHFHMYLEGCEVSTDTLKNYLKKSGITGGSKGAGWSFKLSRDTGCITYMTKGKLEPSYTRGFTEAELEEFKNKWEEREPIKVNGKVQSKLTFIVKETPVQAKKRKNDLVEEMIKCLPECKYDKVIIQTIMKVLNDNQVIFSRYTIRDYFDTIQGRVNTKAFVDKMEIFCAYNR